MAVAPAFAGEGAALSHAELVDQATAQSKSAHTIEALADGRIRMNAPMQDLQADIGPHGLILRSVDEAGSAAFAQRVQAVGRENAMWLPLPAQVRHDGERACALQGVLVQEFSANADGIRQDVLLGEKPTGAGPLQLDPAFENASLHALPAASGDPETQTPESAASPTLHDAVALHMADGRALHYHALHVTDADGQTLAARMTPLSRNRLRIHVQDEGARYPIRIDPTFSDADWTAIAEPGFNGSIQAAVVGSGDLYAGGRFTTAANHPAAIAYAQLRLPQATFSVTTTPSGIAYGGESVVEVSGGSGSGAVSLAITDGAAFCALDGTTVTGTCTLTATKAADVNYLVATATVDVNVTPKADLQLSKDANRASAMIGDIVVFTLVAANAGPNDVTGARLVDTPPGTLADVEWACVPAASSIPCPTAPNDAGEGAMDVLFDLPANQYLRYDFIGTVAGVIGAQIQNSASLIVPAGVTDPATPNDASASVLIVPVGVFADGFENEGEALTVPGAEAARRKP